MQNLDLIISKLQSLSTTELLLITKDPTTIEVGVIPHLQAELVKRGKEKAASALSEYDASKEKPLAHLSKIDLKYHIQQRVSQGESIESIRLDLQDNDIDLFDISFDKIESELEKINFINDLKEKGQDDETIKVELQEAYGITSDETEKLKERRKVKALWNLYLGYGLAICAILLAIFTLSAGGLPIRPLILLCVGIWRIIEGRKMLK